MDNFKGLLQESRRLTAHATGTQSSLPHLQKSLDLIQSASRRLQDSVEPSASVSNGHLLDPRTTFLLAAQGFDPQRLASTLGDIQLGNTMESLEPVADTDLDAFLRNEHDSMISMAIQESRVAALQDALDSFESSMLSDWNRASAKVLEELTSSATGTRGGLAGSLSGEVNAKDQTVTPKLKSYASAVKTLNEGRLSHAPVNALELFQKAASESAVTQDSMTVSADADLVLRSWDLLKTLLKSDSYFEGAYEGANGSQGFSAQLVTQGRTWLESSYLSWLQNHVRGRRAELGGMPSVHDEIEAVIKLRFKRNETWSLPWLDTNTVPGTAFWAHIFFLIRCGLHKETLQYVKAHQQFLDETMDRAFASYLSAWISSPNGLLPRPLRDRLHTEWNGLIRDILSDSRIPPRGDAFKYTLYKLIGRCEMSTKGVKCDAVISSTDDYLWFQLSLVREEVIEPAYERYTLKDFSTKVVGYGQSHFKSLGLYFMVLLLTGEFERAVELLARDSQFSQEALHFAIALVYMGALRLPADPSQSSLTGGYLTTASVQSPSGSAIYQMASFDYARCLMSFIQNWGRSDPVECLQYVYTLGLLSGTPQNKKTYASLAHSAIRDLVLLAPSFTLLLGDIRPDGTRVPGDIEKYKTLIHISSVAEFIDIILLGAAKQAESLQSGHLLSDKSFQRTIQLYHLAGQFEYVLRLLSQQLSETLASRQYTHGPGAQKTVMAKSAKPALAFPESTNIVDLAEQLLEFYKARPHMMSSVSTKSFSSCSLLIALHRFMAQSDDGQDEAALLALERLDLLPLSPYMGLVQRKVDQFRGVEESVARVMPEVLVAAMKSIERLFSTLNTRRHEAPRESLKQDLKLKSKALLMFAGCVQYRIPGDVFATLNRLDVMIS